MSVLTNKQTGRNEARSMNKRREEVMNIGIYECPNIAELHILKYTRSKIIQSKQKVINSCVVIHELELSDSLERRRKHATEKRKTE